MDKFQEVRGTKDLLSADLYKKQYIEDTCQKIASLYGFVPVETPIFEFTEVFTKTLGESSDIITKEMYNFCDKGGESITLRPELTAAIVRLFINKNLQTPAKLFTAGPVFRYERPQKCRQRQFHQVNFECFGMNDFYADVEIITLATQILEELQIKSATVLEINSLGDQDTLALYRHKLVAYLAKYKDSLSATSQQRLITNPLRILDSKSPQDIEILSSAPVISDCYSSAAGKFFEQIISFLTKLDINHSINPRLVRGLDYYCHTVFEFTSSNLGAQSAVLAGGRYDGLVSAMGGKPTAAIGFAGGVERIMALIDYTKKLQRPVAIISLSSKTLEYSLLVAQKLRKNSLSTISEYSGNLQNQLRKAVKSNAKFAIIIGDDELNTELVSLKNLDTQEQQSLSITEVIDILSVNSL